MNKQCVNRTNSINGLLFHTRGFWNLPALLERKEPSTEHTSHVLSLPVGDSIYSVLSISPLGKAEPIVVKSICTYRPPTSLV